ncbi:PTS sugar transporter subunit IIC [Culicoidibacter larvae]|uniref:Permease IIC component n=1 Tax=Culicoidibacter larvae TaxID=2579976 RepID=A0A5R8QDU7_9FIRM|nr:PTS transporter subunit EIIC [Culicoidibacter larvae]TLG75401.1 PTS sugar transporter subunit IIC [Culicoidibacter larvae]
MEMFMKVAAKLSSNRYLGAIRDGFIFALPLTVTASFAILINNVILADNLPFSLSNPAYYGEGFISVIQNVRYIFSSIEFGGLQWIAPIVVMGIAFKLSQASKAERPFTNAIIIFAIFMTILPKGDLVTGGFWQNQWVGGYTAAIESGLPAITFSALFSGSNLFTAILVGIVFTELLLKFQSIKRLEIKLPDQVPPAVAKAFSTLIPAILTFLIAGIVAMLFYVFKPFEYGDLSSFIAGLFQQPFLALAKTNVGGTIIIIVYVFFANFLWFFGLHGPNILSGFATPTLMALGLENQAIFAQTANAYSPELATFTMGFVDAYTQYGGSGATMGLLIAIFFFSKRKDYKAIAELSLAPGIFQINEPVIFGMPIVLNPILGIPFVLAPLVSVIVPGILTSIGWLPKVVVSVPWVMPPVINAFLATGASWQAAVVAVINLVLITLVYLPFVLAANKMIDTNQAVEEVTEA